MLRRCRHRPGRWCVAVLLGPPVLRSRPAHRPDENHQRYPEGDQQTRGDHSVPPDAKADHRAKDIRGQTVSTSATHMIACSSSTSRWDGDGVITTSTPVERTWSTTGSRVSSGGHNSPYPRRRASRITCAASHSTAAVTIGSIHPNAVGRRLTVRSPLSGEHPPPRSGSGTGVDPAASAAQASRGHTAPTRDGRGTEGVLSAYSPPDDGYSRCDHVDDGPEERPLRSAARSV